ncbi:hypothetical protein GA0111570_106123 [Raineyella antarctica]|uniref:Transmembrane protein n=1 Tax=Raineyella antarctica TaxID=1577474 RepID=A0A1G6H4C5_9ACTN|nr:hypothetical protein [Raineyella antarctica]SDB88765.1 hypothetical protein GA0111570_106123 [Raineyella antarctica]
MKVQQRGADDRVLRFTKGLSAFIAPFLIVAFVVLYGFPTETGRLFAWTMRPTMTPMVLASAYLGGFYFFVRALWTARWSSLRVGFLSVALFATLLGVATVIHWDKFNHHHFAFWLWTGLYFTAPFLVIFAYLSNRRFAAPTEASELRLGGVSRWMVALVGLAALSTGITMFVAPGQMIPVWPWALTPLTCRVVGAIFCLGSAGLGVVRDPRWITIRLMLQVEALMIVLMAIAALRASGEFHPERPLTWLLFVGFMGVLAGSAYLWYRFEIAATRRGTRRSG